MTSSPPPTDPRGTPLAFEMVRRSLEQSRDHAIIAIDVDGRVVGWLGASEEVLGWHADEILGTPLADLFVRDDRDLDLPSKELEVARVGGTSEDDRWHLRADGATVWVTGTVEAVHDDAGVLIGYVKRLRDRTDLKAQIATLTQRATDADAATQRQRDVLDRLGHEMRGPLGAIASAAAVIDADRSGAQAGKALDALRRQLKVLQRFADDLHEVARKDHGKIELRRVPVDLVVAASQCVDAVQPRYAAKGVMLVPVMPRAEVRLDADPVRLQQILSNLLDNALKYTPPGGTVWAKISVETPHAVVRIEDTGVGIDAQMLPRIFELFTQEERSASLAEGGLGIGLALVKEYAELHGGLVEVRSSGAGKGSEFTVRLPMPEPPVSIDNAERTRTG